MAAALSGCCPVTESRLGPSRADTFLACMSIVLRACVCSESLQQLRRKESAEEIKRREKG